MSTSGKLFDGVRFQWTPVSRATSYRVVVNDVVVGTITETEYEIRGHSDGDVLSIKVEHRSDGATYTDAPYRTLKYSVESQFTQIYKQADNPNYPRPSFAETFLDPYNPAEYVLIKHAQLNLGTYNSDTDTYTEFTGYTGYKECRRNYQTKELIGLSNDQFRNFGANLANVHAGANLLADHLVYSHSSTVNGFDISYEGTIYFSTNDNEIWSMDADGSNPQLLFSTTGAPGSVATDPYDSDTLVYVDGDDIKYRVLSTGVTTDVIVGNMSGNTGIFVLNGVMYTNYCWKSAGGYMRMNLDGTNVYEYTGRVWSFGFVLDTVNKRAITLEDNEYIVHVDGSIDDLPPDPAGTILVLRPISIEAACQQSRKQPRTGSVTRWDNPVQPQRLYRSTALHNLHTS